MGKNIRTLFLLLVACFLSLGIGSDYAQSQEDSLVVGSVNPVPAGGNVSVDIRLRVSAPVAAIAIPLTFKNVNNLEINLESVAWSHWVAENLEMGDTSHTVDNVNKTVSLTAIWFFGYLPEGNDTLCTMYFRTGPYWDEGITVKIDTTTVPPSATGLALLDTTTWPQADSIRVVFVPGHLGPTWIREVDFGEALVPQQFLLGQNYPNPFNPTTVIRFALPMDGRVKIEVFNVLGQKITTLVDEYLTAGYKETGWDGKDSDGMDVASGIYFYRIKTEKFTDVKKMVFLK